MHTRITRSHQCMCDLCLMQIIAMEFDTFNDCYLCRPVGSE